MKKKQISAIIEIFGVAFLLITISLFLPLSYDAIDDVAMERIVSGYYTNVPDGHILFTNKLIGDFLSILYQFTTTFNWYTIFYLLVNATLSTLLPYAVAHKINGLFGMLIRFILSLGVFSLLFINLQFTLTATISTATGFLLANRYSETKKILLLIVSIFFTLLGFLIRYESGILVGIVFLPLFINNVIEKNKIKSIIIFFSLFVFSYSIAYLYDLNGYRDNDWEHVRTEIASKHWVQDAHVFEKPNVQKELSDNGYSLIDLNAFKHFFYEENEMLEGMGLVSISNIVKRNTNKPLSFNFLKRQLLFFALPIIIGVILLFIGRKRLFILLSLGYFIILLLFANLSSYLYLKDRVYEPVILIYLIIVIYFILEHGNIFYHKTLVLIISILILFTFGLDDLQRLRQNAALRDATIAERNKINEVINTMEVSTKDKYLILPSMATSYIMYPLYIGLSVRKPTDRFIDLPCFWLSNTPIKNKLKTMYGFQKHLEIRQSIEINKKLLLLESKNGSSLNKYVQHYYSINGLDTVCYISQSDYLYRIKK